MTAAGTRAVAAYRRRAAKKGLVRVEVLVRKRDVALIRRLARELSAGGADGRQERRAWRDLMNAQATGLAAIWENAEDEAWDRV
jgi:chorismate mutase